MNRFATVSGLALLAAAGAAIAQEAQAPEPLPTVPAPPLTKANDDEEPARDTGTDGTRLEDVVVTATKRKQSVREIPAAVTALHGEDLEKIGARELQDYITLVPGITLQDSEGSNGATRKLTVRGVGPGGENTTFVNANQTVGLFIGDVPMTDPYSNFVVPDLDPYDLASVEVLKGPQGTNFGASALNGAIRYVPNAPELNAWSGRGFVNYLSYREGDFGFTYGALVNAPIGETLAVRATGVLQNAPGLIDNVQRGEPDADSRRKWSARGGLLWQPAERFKLALLYLQQESHTDDAIYSTDPDGHYRATNSPGPGDIRGGFRLGTLDARYDLEDWGELVLQSSVQRKSQHLDMDGKINFGTDLEIVRALVDIGTRGTTHELRLVSPGGGNWSWIAGGFWQDYRALVDVDLPLANTAILGGLFPDGIPGAMFLSGLFPAGLPGSILTANGVSLQTSRVTAKAGERSLFGELGRKLGAHWEVTAGTRYYRTELKGRVTISGPAAATYATNGSQQDIEQRHAGFSPRVSLKWKMGRDFMAYASLSRGFQFGGINAPPLLSAPDFNPVTGVPVPPSFRSSKLWSRELGLRSDWLDRTLRLDLTLFDLDWSDAQFSQFAGGITNNGYIDNVGKVRSQGVEASAAWLTPLRGVALNLAGTYIRARTAEPYDDGSGRVVPEDTDVPATPRVQAAGTLAYNGAFGPWIAGAAFTAAYTGRAFSNIRHESAIFDYTLLGFDLTLSRPDLPGMPSLAFGIANLTDERAVLSYTPPATTGVPSWSYSKPRALTLTLGAEFR